MVESVADDRLDMRCATASASVVVDVPLTDSAPQTHTTDTPHAIDAVHTADARNATTAPNTANGCYAVAEAPTKECQQASHHKSASGGASTSRHRNAPGRTSATSDCD